MWTPAAGDGAPAELKVPNLVAIPNVLVDLLRTQGSAVTPYNVLLLSTTLSKKVESRVITGITSGNGAWWQAKRMPTEKARCFLTPPRLPLMMGISTDGSETVST